VKEEEEEEEEEEQEDVYNTVHVYLREPAAT
jgi:hypothetical protein